MRSFWSANSFVVLFFLAVLMSSLVLSGRSVDTIVQRYSLSGNSFSFISWKYELRSSISCTRGHIFAILSSLYFGTTMYFTSLVLNTYKINGIKISDAPFSSLQGLLSWNPMMSFDNLEGNIALNKKKFMIDVLRSAVSKLYKSRLLPNFPNSSSGGW